MPPVAHGDNRRSPIKTRKVHEERVTRGDFHTHLAMGAPINLQNEEKPSQKPLFHFQGRSGSTVVGVAGETYSESDTFALKLNLPDPGCPLSMELPFITGLKTIAPDGTPLAIYHYQGDSSDEKAQTDEHNQIGRLQRKWVGEVLQKQRALERKGEHARVNMPVAMPLDAQLQSALSTEPLEPQATADTICSAQVWMGNADISPFIINENEKGRIIVNPKFIAMLRAAFPLGLSHLECANFGILKTTGALDEGKPLGLSFLDYKGSKTGKKDLDFRPFIAYTEMDEQGVIDNLEDIITELEEKCEALNQNSSEKIKQLDSNFNLSEAPPSVVLENIHGMNFKLDDKMSTHDKYHQPSTIYHPEALDKNGHHTKRTLEKQASCFTKLTKLIHASPNPLGIDYAPKPDLCIAGGHLPTSAKFAEKFNQRVLAIKETDDLIEKNQFIKNLEQVLQAWFATVAFKRATGLLKKTLATTEKSAEHLVESMFATEGEPFDVLLDFFGGQTSGGYMSKIGPDTDLMTTDYVENSQIKSLVKAVKESTAAPTYMAVMKAHAYQTSPCQLLDYTKEYTALKKSGNRNSKQTVEIYLSPIIQEKKQAIVLIADSLFYVCQRGYLQLPKLNSYYDKQGFDLYENLAKECQKAKGTERALDENDIADSQLIDFIEREVGVRLKGSKTQGFHTRLEGQLMAQLRAPAMSVSEEEDPLSDTPCRLEAESALLREQKEPEEKGEMRIVPLKRSCPPDPIDALLNYCKMNTALQDIDKVIARMGSCIAYYEQSYCLREDEVTKGHLEFFQKRLIQFKHSKPSPEDMEYVLGINCHLMMMLLHLNADTRNRAAQRLTRAMALEQTPCTKKFCNGVLLVIMVVALAVLFSASILALTFSFGAPLAPLVTAGLISAGTQLSPLAAASLACMGTVGAEISIAAIGCSLYSNKKAAARKKEVEMVVHSAHHVRTGENTQRGKLLARGPGQADADIDRSVHNGREGARDRDSKSDAPLLRQ